MRTADTMMASNRLSSFIAVSSGRSRVSKLDTTASFTSASHVAAAQELSGSRQHTRIDRESGMRSLHLDVRPDMHTRRSSNALACISQAIERRHRPRCDRPGLRLRKVCVQIL